MRNAVVAWLCLGLSLPAASQSHKRVEVDDPRPLMKLIDELQRFWGIPIHYEDPPFGHPDDLEDITHRVPQTPAQRAANPGVRFIVPRGGSIAITIPREETGPPEPKQIRLRLTRAIQAYETKGYPGRFTVIDRHSVWSIEPVEIRSRGGRTARTESVLAKRITAPVERRNAMEYLQLLVNQLAGQIGVKIGIGSLPIVAFANTNALLGANNEPAHAAISTLLTELTRSSAMSPGKPFFSYRLLYDPKLQYYVLNISSPR